MKLLPFTVLLLVGCQSKPTQQVDIPVSPKIDTTVQIVDVPVIKPEVVPVQTVKPKQAVKPQDLAGETIYYFKGNHRGVSAIYTMWKAGKRTLLVYGEDGNLTFTHNEMNSSYMVYSEILSFHSTGAIQTLKIVEQPDGGIQRYEATVTFNSVNTPLMKRVEKYPQRLDDDFQNEYRWDSLERDWVRLTVD